MNKKTAQGTQAVPKGFDTADLLAVADGLDCYEKTFNVGNNMGLGDELLESTTAYAARFIRAVVAAAPKPPAVGVTLSDEDCAELDQLYRTIRGAENGIEAVRIIVSAYERKRALLASQQKGD